MKKLIYFICLLIFPLTSQALVWGDIAMGFTLGSGRWSEANTTTSETFDHNYGVTGFELSAKTGVNFLWFYGGVTGAAALLSYSGTREQTSGEPYPGVNTYDLNITRILYGPHAAFQIPITRIRLFVEYYPKVTGEVKSSETLMTDPDNPIIASKGDTLTGKGGGAGIYYYDDNYSLTIIYRKVIYNEFSHDGTIHLLPNDKYPTELQTNTVTISGGLMF